MTDEIKIIIDAVSDAGHPLSTKEVLAKTSASPGIDKRRVRKAIQVALEKGDLLLDGKMRLAVSRSSKKAA